ncbi:hypothetical protein BDY24DRAFT_393939, partial [Mrakia frigida]|uniref:uncharacterized protein n=1 Tax=Mrakia frigida TaxID=29902 RepID=UPI003FCBFA6C
ASDLDPSLMLELNTSLPSLSKQPIPSHPSIRNIPFPGSNHTKPSRKGLYMDANEPLSDVEGEPRRSRWSEVEGGKEKRPTMPSTSENTEEDFEIPSAAQKHTLL